AGQRHRKSDLDGLAGRSLGAGGNRQRGESSTGEERGDDASPFQSYQHSFLQLVVFDSFQEFFLPLRYSLSSYRQTSSASSTIMASFAHCSSSARTLPSSVEAKPHCGDRHSWSRATYFVASSIRRLMSSLFSSLPLFDVTRPITTCLRPLGTKRSGSKPPARSVSYSRK